MDVTLSTIIKYYCKVLRMTKKKLQKVSGLDNLQIISWFENRAKCDMTQQELNDMINKYWRE